jgi:3-oxoacyl-[acyl-carrier-protein] synthase II
MSVYINSSSMISPQKTFDGKITAEGRLLHTGVRLNCVEPNYAELIDPKAIRRMSRIIRMGVAAGTAAVKKAGLAHPDAIIIGTAFGCLEDTHSFISRMTEYGEDMLNPTPFIHSTHNTIAGQIALHFKCHGYNSTYVHRAVSFESVLLDGFMQVEEGSIGNALIGGTDEMIDA